MTKFEDISYEIIGAAIDVHKALGPGLLESCYEACLQRELELRGHKVQRQVALPMVYKGVKVEDAFRLDLLVDDMFIIELKSVAEVTNLHIAQAITYLRLCEFPKGLLINFNVSLLKDGIHEIFNNEL